MLQSRLTILSLLLCLHTIFIAQGQQYTLSGMVRNSATNQPVSDVLCRAMDTHQQRYYGYATTDSNGQYHIRLTSLADTLLLIVSSMGFETHSTLLPGTTTRHDVMLKESPFVLKEITVAPPTIWKQGDTLNYNVDKLKSSADYAIVDVLKKLPGIEVSDNGYITYQGIGINKFYIEGLDLMGYRYNIAATGIPAEAISNIQVIENHQPVKALDGISHSDAAALNLLLKKNYRMRPVLNANLGGGYSPEQWLRTLSLTGMQIGKRRQTLLTFRHNNTGSALAGELTKHGYDATRQQQQWRRLFTPAGAIIPSEITQSSLFNDSYLATLNHLVSLNNNDAQLRLTASYLNEVGKRNYSLHHAYYLANGNYSTVSEINRTVDHNQAAELTATYTLNKKSSYLENSFTLSGTWHTIHTQTNNTAATVDQSFRLPQFDATNHLQLIHRKKLNTIRLNSTLLYIARPQQARFVTDSLQPEQIGLARQQTGLRTFSTANNLTLSHSIGSSTWTTDVALNIEADAFRSDLNTVQSFTDTPKRNYLLANRYEMVASPSYGFRHEDLNLTLSLPISLFRLQHASSGRNYLFLQPAASIRYQINKFWTAIASYHFQRQTGDMLEFADGLRLLNYRTLNHGSGHYEIRTSHSLTARLMYQQPVEAFFFNASLIYRPSESNLITATAFAGNQQTHSQLPGLFHRHNLITTANVAKYVDALQTNISLIGSYNYTKFERQQQYKLYHFAGHSFHVEAKIDSKLLHNNSISLQTLLLGSRMQTATRPATFANQWRITAAWHYYPHPNWMLSLKSRYSANQLPGNPTTQLLLADADIHYRKPKWEIILSGRNLFDNKSYDIITEDGLNTFRSHYALFRRQLLASIRFKL